MAGAALLLALLTSTGSASADIDPPAGYEWLRTRRVTIESVPADHVLVVWPCHDGPQTALEPYCVVRAGDSFHPNGLLYAIPSKLVKTAPYRPDKPDPRARPGQLVIVEPRIELESRFFKDDPRVVRPGFELGPGWSDRTPSRTGVREAEFFLRVDRVDPKGIEARFVRARYSCRSGASVVLDWGDRQDESPVPSCPATDDRGQVIPTGDPGATGDLATDWARRPSALPVSPRQAIWLGALVSSLSLIGLGVMLRRRKQKPD
jgi:hypothetical protein